jgi:hypothetical protein
MLKRLLKNPLHEIIFCIGMYYLLSAQEFHVPASVLKRLLKNSLNEISFYIGKYHQHRNSMCRLLCSKVLHIVSFS